jgi:hypothetical protein
VAADRSARKLDAVADDIILERVGAGDHLAAGPPPGRSSFTFEDDVTGGHSSQAFT